MGTEVVKYRAPEKLNRLLAPLLDGKPVVVSVNVKRMRLKKRIGTPLLYITPLPVYGLPEYALLFSMPGYGSEAIPIKHITPTSLYRVGIPLKAAKILANELTVLFK